MPCVSLQGQLQCRGCPLRFKTRGCAGVCVGVCGGGGRVMAPKKSSCCCCQRCDASRLPCVRADDHLPRRWMWHEPQLPRESCRELLAAVMLLLRYRELQGEVRATHSCTAQGVAR